MMNKNKESLQVIACMYGDQLYSTVVQYYLGFNSEDEAIKFLNSFCENGELRRIDCYNYHNKGTYKIEKYNQKTNCDICPDKQNCDTMII